MTTILLGGLAAGAITVAICTSALGGILRSRMEALHERLGDLVNCCFCTSWWVSIAMLEKFSLVEWAATVAIANITVLLIHLSAATVGEDEDVELDSQLDRAEELQSSVAGSDRGEVRPMRDQYSGILEVHPRGELATSDEASPESIENRPQYVGRHI